MGDVVEESSRRGEGVRGADRAVNTLQAEQSTGIIG
jgi:hypothetical protein